jgi:hypothetical protein
MDMNGLTADLLKRHADKKIIIFGAGAGGQALYRFFERAGVEVLYFIDNYKKGNRMFGKAVNSPYDILYEKISDILVVISACRDCHVFQIKEQLVGLGLKEGVHFETVMFNDLYAPLDYLDPFLGYNRGGDLMGFKIFGKDSARATRIVVLGGSTSDPSFGGYKSWPEYLHEQCVQSSLDAVVYNGAIAGYFSAQEMLKCIRDCLTLSPDIVITFDGFNDAVLEVQPEYPLFHPYCKKTFDTMFEATARIDISINHELKGVTLGCENHGNRPQRWYQNLRIIRAICQEFNIRYLPFLQPTSLYRQAEGVEDDGKKSAIERFYGEAALLARQSGFILDATSILDGIDSAYVDFAHYSESGNEAIAQFVFQFVGYDEDFAHQAHGGRCGPEQGDAEAGDLAVTPGRNSSGYLEPTGERAR